MSERRFVIKEVDDREAIFHPYEIAINESELRQRAVLMFNAKWTCKEDIRIDILLHGDGEKGEEWMRKQKEHKLKTWPGFFAEVATGAKTFEVRKYDRDFRVGDILILQEYDPGNGTYTGDELRVVVDYSVVLDGIPGMTNGFIGMSISDEKPSPTPTREEWKEWIENMPMSIWTKQVQDWLISMPIVPKE